MKSSNKALIIDLLKVVKSYLLNVSGTELISMDEKWHLAQYYCSLYQLDEVKFKDHLNMAKNLIVSNPHPTVYRTILMNLFKQSGSAQQDQGDDTNRISYLLETQSTALRHKAHAIHMKHRRKATIDSKLSEKFIKSIAFKNSADMNYLQSFMKSMLPKDLCVLALVLVPEEMDLYLIRLEKSIPPLLTKFKYNRKYTDEFKQIMIDNDKSMKQSDRNKFWTSRNALNKKLNTFMTELEENVFASKKAAFLGSYVDFDSEKMLGEFKEQFGLGSSSKMNNETDQLLKNVFLGVEFYTSEEIKSILRSIFGSKTDEKLIDSYLNYFVDVVKPTLTGAKRKHVCLLNDKVSFYLCVFISI